VYGEYCQSCHWVTPTDERGKAPSLAGIASRAGETVAGLDARAYIEQSILQPGVHLVPGYRNNMPDNYASRLAPEEREAVINYLLTLE
jgi:mono/diheme cytochrome c family protein